MDALYNALQFINDTFFDLIITLLMARVILRYLHITLRNPVVHFIDRVTRPIIVPVSTFLPEVAGIELSTLFICLLVAMLKIILLPTLILGAHPPMIWLIIHAVAEILSTVLNIYLFSIIILALVSWLNPGNPNPMLDILYLITAPLLMPVRRMLPVMSGIDFSPMVVIFLLYLIRIVVISPMLSVA